MLKINYHHWHSFISRLIQFVSGDFYNHVSVEVNDYVYEAHINTGVIKTRIDEWDDSTVHKTQIFECTPKRMATTVRWMDKQIGKGYDLLWVLSFVWIFLKQKKGKFFCSEFWYICLMKWIGMLSSQYSPRKKPQDVYEVGEIILSIK